MKLVKFLILASVLLTQNSFFSQQGMMLYQMENVPQASYLNPAFDLEAKTTIGIPALSSIYFQVNNSIFQPGNLFDQNEGHVTFNSEGYLVSIEDQNHFGANVALDIFSVGKKIKKMYVSLAMRERIFTRLTLPGDFLRFPYTGNANFDEIENGVLDFSGLGVEFNHYRELGLGVRIDLTKKLNVGGRIKLLYGYENITTSESSLTWRTNPETWDWNINGQLAFNTSSIIADTSSTEAAEFSPKEYVMNRKNRGLGLDLGLTYQLTGATRLSFSLVDLGRIKWKTNVKNSETNNVNFLYSGLDISEDIALAGGSISDSLEVAIEDLKDEFKDIVSVDDNTTSYKTSLLTQTYLGAQIEVLKNEKFLGKVGFTLHTEYFKHNRYNSFTVSYNQKFTKHLNALVSYSIMHNDNKNIGAGLVVKFAGFQLYAAMDNLMALNMTKVKFGNDSNSVPIPTYSKTVHGQFGINIVIAENKKRRIRKKKK